MIGAPTEDQRHSLLMFCEGDLKWSNFYSHFTASDHSIVILFAEYPGSISVVMIPHRAKMYKWWLLREWEVNLLMQSENHQQTRPHRRWCPTCKRGPLSLKIELNSKGVDFEVLFLINKQIFVVFMRIEKILSMQNNIFYDVNSLQTSTLWTVSDQFRNLT